MNAKKAPAPPKVLSMPPLRSASAVAAAEAAKDILMDKAPTPAPEQTLPTVPPSSSPSGESIAPITAPPEAVVAPQPVASVARIADPKPRKGKAGEKEAAGRRKSPQVSVAFTEAELNEMNRIVFDLIVSSGRTSGITISSLIRGLVNFALHDRTDRRESALKYVAEKVTNV